MMDIVSVSFVLVGLLIKLGAAPFHLWLIDVYRGAPFTTVFYLSIVPKLAYICTLLRMMEAFGHTPHGKFVATTLSVIALISVVWGGLGALKTTT
jgi:NADH-quinone oxidoreductase subunit N